MNYAFKLWFYFVSTQGSPILQEIESDCYYRFDWPTNIICPKAIGLFRPTTCEIYNNQTCATVDLKTITKNTNIIVSTYARKFLLSLVLSSWRWMSVILRYVHYINIFCIFCHKRWSRIHHRHRLMSTCAMATNKVLKLIMLKAPQKYSLKMVLAGRMVQVIMKCQKKLIFWKSEWYFFCVLFIFSCARIYIGVMNVELRLVCKEKESEFSWSKVSRSFSFCYILISI